MTYDEIIESVIAEFSTFVRPGGDKFKGGRFQTKIKHVFAHVDGSGTLRLIEWDKPGGTRFQVKIHIRA